ncbi:MAG: hypothetical protein JWR44_2524 [Hymenobacter sp.]|jgi:hypothetical protein|nr:hypothetical protein [Hymenobacter sp.]
MKILVFIVVSLGAAACQHTSSPRTKLETEALGAQAPAVTISAKRGPVLIGVASDTLTAPMRALLREYNLTLLWSNTNRADSLSNSNGSPVLEGFFGPEHYRIGLAFNHVVRDSINPALFHVLGKSKYAKAIVPFEGTIEITRLTDLKTFLDLAEEDSAAQAYTADGHFIFRESAAHRGAGTFEGTGLLDFYITPKGEIGQVIVMSGQDNPARGRGLLLKGMWTSYHTKQQKTLLMSRDVFSIAPDVLKDFGVGERSAQVNPKYAKLGWSDYWENDEWWADSPKPSLNL